VIQAVKRLRELSPLYEMVQEGIDLSKIDWTSHQAKTTAKH
jgi:cysteine desulfurase